jgi:hypothetical protein
VPLLRLSPSLCGKPAAPPATRTGRRCPILAGFGFCGWDRLSRPAPKARRLTPW